MAPVQIAKVADVPEGTGKTFQIGAHPIAIFNVAGAFYALADTCSHAEASLGEGELDTDEMCVECPLHGSLFDLETGKPRTLPAYDPVATYKVWTDGDALFVDYSD
ncbi:MAG: non-heme iron oxygenase ferredoxin subunit [Chloroflexales bacterium]|nr:non-heme iron oxygenase ferredoxin subunit [Chloroflexales bacterium]